jgi:hypothetical protein
MSASVIMPSQSTPTFDLFALRFECRAQTAVHFSVGETANLFRGQFGKVLHRRHPSVYARLFAPVAEADSPSGLHDPPRPFVWRVRHLEGIKATEFHVGLNLFETHPEIDVIRDAVTEVVRESLRAELVGDSGREALQLPLVGAIRTERVRVHFLTPTELKNADRPEFGALFARVRDRISTLRACYGSGPLEIDFKARGERANAIQMTRCEIRQVETERSTGQRHGLGGFLGVAEYEGDLTDFIPYLEIARYTGVGRQTVWGKGEIEVETF